jgi:hypothetical protein
MASTRRNLPSRALLLGVFAPYVMAETWDNSSGNAQWSTATNWADNTEPTSMEAVVFPSTIPLNQATILMTTMEFASSLTFNNDYTLQGGQMFIIGGASTSLAHAPRPSTPSSMGLRGSPNPGAVISTVYVPESAPLAFSIRNPTL